MLLVPGAAVDGLAQPAIVVGTSGRLAAAPSRQAGREEQAVAKLTARGLPVYCAGGRAKEVALTFDDGPTGHAPRLLAALRRTPATFFLIGESATRYRRYARGEAAAGSVGAHGQSHATPTSLGTADARREIAEGKRSVERAIGQPVRLFRPAGGHRNATIDRIAAEQDLLSILYTVDPRDWALRNAASVAAAVTSDPRLVPGAIVLLHEFNPSTIEAVPAIVHELRRRALRPVSVPRLLADDPPTLAEQRRDARAGSCVHLYRR